METDLKELEKLADVIRDAVHDDGWIPEFIAQAILDEGYRKQPTLTAHIVKGSTVVDSKVFIICEEGHHDQCSHKNNGQTCGCECHKKESDNG